MIRLGTWLGFNLGVSVGYGVRCKMVWFNVKGCWLLVKGKVYGEWVVGVLSRWVGL